MSKPARKKAARPTAQPAASRPRTQAARTPRVVQHTRAKFYWATGALALVVLLVVSFLVDSNRPSSSSASARLPVGSRASHFTGLDPLTGQMINSTYFAGKNILFYFSAGSSCQACVTQAQALQRDNQQLTRDHIVLVMVTNDSSAGLVAAAHAYSLSIPMVADPGGAITRRFDAIGGGMSMGPNSADHSFMLVDRHGIVRFHQDFPGMWISTSALLHRFPMMT
ncbi:MAG TPA: redoxin domain-containing protein [Acidimicrobiales bacterium]|nr:redoxin domain-containing protein [Acidimicrobiales bacterium]